MDASEGRRSHRSNARWKTPLRPKWRSTAARTAWWKRSAPCRPETSWRCTTRSPRTSARCSSHQGCWQTRASIHGLGLVRVPDRKEALVSHPRARLTPFGRLLLVTRVLEQGWSVSAAAESMGVSRATAHKWLRRFGSEGLAGLEDRSSAPHHHPNALSAREVRRIFKARRRRKHGPHRLGPALGHPRSTVYGVLRREGLSRLTHLDRPTSVPIPHERERAGGA